MHNGSQFTVQVDVKLLVMEESARSSTITIQLTEEVQFQLQNCAVVAADGNFVLYFFREGVSDGHAFQ